MLATRRMPCIGRVLAVGALLGLAGCHQLPSQLDTASGWGREPSGGRSSITPAQEADIQISMGRVAEKQGNPEQAMAAYRAALTRDSRRVDAHLRLAVLHDQQGKFRESAELYRKALALRPGDPDIFCDMGYSFYLQRRWAESESNLRQAIAVDPDHRRAHNNLALLLVRDNRKEDALAEFRKGGSSPAQAHMNLAFALTMDERWESARAEYERALALDPSLKLAKDRLGQLNALLAKMEGRRDGTTHDPRVLTTATGAPPPRRDVPRPNAIAAATTEPLEAARPRAVRDPGLVATAAKVNPVPRSTRAHVSAPPLPAEDKAMGDLWTTADAHADATPRRRPDTSAGGGMASPEKPAPESQPRIHRPKDSPAGPSMAIEAPGTAPDRRLSSKRVTIPPPRPARTMAAGRPNAAHSTSSGSVAKPGPVRIPPSGPSPVAQPVGFAAPAQPAEGNPDTVLSRTSTAQELPPFQTVP